MVHGTILCAEDFGSLWRLLYKTDADRLGVVTFDHRPFAAFYEGATGSSFFIDYACGRGVEYVSHKLGGIRISVSGRRFTESVRLED